MTHDTKTHSAVPVSATAAATAAGHSASPDAGRRTVFITGSTSGIGLELARQYLAKGWRVLTHGRCGAPAGFDAAEHLRLDFAPPAGGWGEATGERVGSAVRRFLAERGVTRLHLLINNAALAHYGPLAEQGWESVAALTAINVTAPTGITWHVWGLLAACGGTVLFISSVAAALATPQYAVYSATKAALDGLVRSLRQESIAAGTGVSVRVAHPAGTTTAMHERAGFPQEKLSRMKFTPAETVARRIISRLESGQNGPLTPAMRAACLLCRKLPHLVDRLTARSHKARWNGTPATGAEGGLTLITGAASGIGRALWQAASSPMGVDRVPCVDHAAPWHVADLTDPDALRSLTANLEPSGITTAIWNAGINAAGRFWDIPWPRQEAVLRLNLLAPFLLGQWLAARRPGATQVFLSSLSHHVSYPGASVYAATKDGVAHYARSLRASGIHTLVVFPGPTDTPHAARHSPPALAAKPSSRLAPEVLAAKILAAAAKSRATLVPTAGHRILALVGHFLPPVAEAAMRRVLFAKMPAGWHSGGE